MEVIFIYLYVYAYYIFLTSSFHVHLLWFRPRLEVAIIIQLS